MKDPNPNDALSSYRSPFTTLQQYWRNYGGFAALLTSPFLHAALVMALVCALWPPSTSWAERTIAVIPSLLGLTLAGYAILLAIGSEKFLKRLARPGNAKKSVLENLSTSFLHFVLVQAAALMLALIAESLAIPVRALLTEYASEALAATVRFACRWLGWTAMFYSITCSLAATFRLFRMVGWFVRDISGSSQQ